MRSKQLLEHVATLLDERQRDYGSPKDNFNRIARRWSVLLNKELSAQEVALMMLDFKLARLQHNPKHFDSLVDVIGYAACLAELK
ncbi:MAG: hypothetical protein CMO81_11760 [Waddliaceae bacterium]|nr:hypothetical protein [Waddliaceae bacterium]|tara:strand:- start:118 stop:372 length:255 start_codon:yes stop_codon:yes gene_type:complete